MDIKLLLKIIFVLFITSIFSNAYANNDLSTIHNNFKNSDSIGHPTDSKIPAILKFNQNTIAPNPDATLGGTGSGTTVDAFKICTTASTAVFTFTNLSTTAATNQKYIIKWGDGSADFVSTTNWPSTTHTYAVGLRTLTYIVESATGTTTKNYTVFLGSNPAIALGNPGNTDICIGDWLTFPITGTLNNDPGTIYTVTINDGTPPQIFTHATLPASITHQFNKKSCGTTSSDGSTDYPNSFSINIVATNLCTSSSVGVVPIYVSALPIAKFSGPTKACINTQVCFANTSEGFQVSGGLCLEPKNVWSISPATGYTISGGSVLGNDYGSDDASVWALGSNDLCITFTVAGTYSITIKSGSKCGLNDYTDTYTRTICIEPQLVAAFSTSVTQGCAPLAVTTTNTTVGVNQCPPTVYQWDVNYSSSNCGGGSGNYTYTNGTNANSAEPKFNFIEPGTYTVTLNTSNSCGSSPITKTIVVKGPPKVSIQNISSICQNTAITTISPSATINKCTSNASGMTYAWSFPGGTPSSSTSENPGNITYNTTGTFTVSLTVTNECGSKTANNKTFTIYPLPVISGVLSACVNKTSKLTASIAGNTWTSSPSGIVSISNSGLVTGLTAGTTTITFKDVNGCTKSEIFKVNPLPTATITSDQTICKGATAEITLTGANGVAPYTFTYNINNSANITTTTTSGNKVIITVPTNVTGTFTYNLIKVIDASTTSCENNQASSATVIINKIPTVTLQPIGPQKICLGETINTLEAVVDGGAGNTNFQWYKNTNNSSFGGTLIPGATNDKFTPPTFATAGTFYYYVTATLSANGCGVATSASAEVTVAPDPTIISQPITPQTLCLGSPAKPLILVADSGNSDPLNYQWYSNAFNSNMGGTPILNEVYDTYLPPTTTLGTFYYYCVIKPLGLDCEKVSNVAVVNVVSGSSITMQPQPSAVCVGGTPTKLSVGYINGTGTVSYQWFSNTINSNAGGTAILGATSADYNPPASVKGILYYYCEITFSAGGCNNLVSDTAEVKINEGLNIASKNVTVCSGETFTIAPDNSNGDTVPVGTTYTWTYPTFTPSSGITGASSASSAQNNITQTLVNTTRNPITVTFTVKPFGGICLGSDFTVTVTVNPTIDVATEITNSTCYGVANGVIKATITGGTPITIPNPYNILWNGPNGFTATTANISNLKAGIYYLSVDAGCAYTNSYTVTQPEALVLTTDNEKDITCFEDADGAIAISVAGGTAPYTYQWTKNNIPFATTEDITNLAPGTYKVTVTDAKNCTPVTNTYTITEPNLLVVTLINQTPKLCFGTSTGFINISTQGGTPISGINYNYAWSGPDGFVSTDQNLNNLKAGTYNLTVTDNAGCTDDLAVTILETDEILITATTTPITCFGLDNASITVTITGGTPSYTIAWSNLSSGLFQENLSAGDYTIKVVDAFGCEKELTINIPAVPVFSVNPISKNISCFGANDGSIALNLAGDVSQIKLVWSDGSTAGTTRNNLPPGQYTVTMNNGSPCEIVRSFTIIEPLEIAINAGFSQPDACNATDNGMIDLQVSGGTKPYNYSWTKNNIPFSSDEDLSNLSAGIYNVSVTDANFCAVKFKTFVLTKPSVLKVELISQTPKVCFGSNDGSIVINASGGTPIEITSGVFDYQYSWTGPNGFSSASKNLNHLYAGTYKLVLRDKSGCTQDLEVIIQESDEIIIKATTTPITCFGTNDATIAVTVTGGNPNYQITWSNGASGLKQENLAAGNYTITVKDALGCEKVMNINIAPVQPITLNPIIKNTTCFGINNGSIDLNFADNSSVVPLLWSDGSPAGTTRNNLKPGIYKVTINSGSLCQIERIFEITSPKELTLNANVTQPDACNPSDNGMIDLIVSGGTAPYSYQWTKNNITLSSSEDVSNIGAGTYVVKVTDANNCALKTATYTIIKPTALAIKLLSQTTQLCFGSDGGSIAINANGGTPIILSSGVSDYNYAWTGPNGFKSSSKNINKLIAGTYNLVVSDASSCSQNLSVTILPSDEIRITAKTTPITCSGLNDGSIAVTVSGGNPSYNITWSNKGTGLNQNNLAPGDYTIFVTDAFGCENKLTIKIDDTPALNVNPVVKNVSCFGANDGSITLNFAGGNTGVKLTWTDGVTSGTTRNNLGPGTYTVNINNGSLCELKRTFEIIEPKGFEINARLEQPNNCNNSYSGAINLSVSGGIPPYNFEWSNGMTTKDLTRLVAGNYMVTITDANGCSKKQQYTLNNVDPIEVTVETKMIVDCQIPTSQQDFTAEVYGGSPPYTFKWSNSGSGKSSSPYMSTTKNGLITLLVTDANGCAANYSYDVKLPEVNKPDFENNSIGYTSYGAFSINDPIQFTNTTNGDYTGILWDFGDGTFSTESNPVHTYTMPKHYAITQKVTYPYGCEYLNQVTLEVEKGYLLVLPNAFTPNNDGTNDTFRPVTRAMTKVRMDVYDTWGSLIYSETADSLVGWDGFIKGKPSENGNFFCQVSGQTFYGEIITATTTFALIK